jgi:hypothetical protein
MYVLGCYLSDRVYGVRVMAGASLVARKKVKKSVRSVAFRVTEDFGAWLEAYAKFKRMTVSTLMDQALARMAAEDGFKKPPGRV